MTWWWFVSPTGVSVVSKTVVEFVEFPKSKCNKKFKISQNILCKLKISIEFAGVIFPAVWSKVYSIFIYRHKK